MNIRILNLYQCIKVSKQKGTILIFCTQIDEERFINKSNTVLTEASEFTDGKANCNHFKSLIF